MARDLQPCGTHAAYKRHIRYHQVPCEPCSQANRAYNSREARQQRDIRKLVHVLACALGVGRRL